MNRTFWKGCRRPALAAGGIMLVSALSFSVLPVAAEATSISVSPAAQQVRAGDSFTVAVEISSDQEIWGGQCSLSFDPAVVRVDEVVEGELFQGWADNNSSDTIVFPEPVIDAETGKVSVIGVAVLRSADATGLPGPTGSGTLCVYHMTALADGVSDIGLGDIEIHSESLDKRGVPLGVKIEEVMVNGGKVEVTSSAAPTSPSAPTATPTNPPVSTEPAPADAGLFSCSNPLEAAAIPSGPGMLLACLPVALCAAGSFGFLKWSNRRRSRRP